MNWLYYREEHSQDGGITLKSPLGVETTGARRLVFEGKPWTTPEVVHQFRDFVTLLTSSGYRVVVGIDELDEIDDDSHAIRLLNDMKALFGLPDCYFLVSISLSALARFEQRGLPFQDAFESALDEVVRLEAFEATETVELLQRRLLGMPKVSALVCHVVGRGLPRDVMRAVRDLIRIEASYPEAGGQWERLLVLGDLHNRVEAARLSYELKGGEPSPIVRRLCALTESEYDSREWLRAAAATLEEARWLEGDGQARPESSSQDQEPDPAMRALARLGLYVVWAVTAEVWIAQLTNEDQPKDGDRAALAEELAKCRRLLAYDLREAARVLDRARRALRLEPVGQGSNAHVLASPSLEWAAPEPRDLYARA